MLSGQIQLQRAQFDSLEELSQALDQLGWDSGLLQLDQSPGRTTYLAVGSERVMITRFDFSNRLHQRAVPLQGYHTFGMLTGPQAPARFSGREMGEAALSHMDPANGLDAISEAGFSGYTLAFREDLLQELALTSELAAPGFTGWTSSPGDIALNAEVLAALREQIACFLAGAASNNLVDDALEWLESELPSQLLQIGNGNARPGPVRARTRMRVRRKALEFLQANEREPLTVERLCEVSASSISTLERAFREEYGVSPKRYLLLNRLSGVRRSLLEEPPERSITDIAGEWSFSHMGKFAADYRRAFGELPSETRSQRPRGSASAAG